MTPVSERERWRNVRRAPGYQVSSEGRVRGPGGPLTPFPDRDGYLRVNIRGEQVLVHTLVLEAFHGLRPYGMEACHSPDLSLGRQDCRAVVLRWGTHRENERDKKKTEDMKRTGGSPPYPPVTAVTTDVLR
jgi:hypothetical protein